MGKKRRVRKGEKEGRVNEVDETLEGIEKGKKRESLRGVGKVEERRRTRGRDGAAMWEREKEGDKLWGK